MPSPTPADTRPGIPPAADPGVLSIAFTHRELCTRCGTCTAACPVEAMRVGAGGYPEVDPSRCTGCGRGRRTCPGGRVSYRRLAALTFGDDRDDDVFDGRVLENWLVRAADPDVRGGAASGGAVTALLLHLLRTGAVDACVVTRMRRDDPASGEAFLAETEEEVLAARQSRYSVIPVNAALAAARRRPGRVAVVGLPCHVHGLRLLLEEDRALREKVALVIGLYCSSALDPQGLRDLLWARGLPPGSIRDLRFRDGPWPGAVRALDRNGRAHRLHPSNFKDGAINYLFALYAPLRCRLCYDGSAEFADLAASDVWRRAPDGGFIEPATTRLVVRTPAGRAALAAALEAGALDAREVTADSAFLTGPSHARSKRIRRRLRLERRQARGLPVPAVDRRAPPAGGRERAAERAESVLAALEKAPRLRRWLLKALTSPAGWPLIWLRRLRKRRVYG